MAYKAQRHPVAGSGAAGCDLPGEWIDPQITRPLDVVQRERRRNLEAQLRLVSLRLRAAAADAEELADAVRWGINDEIIACMALAHRDLGRLLLPPAPTSRCPPEWSEAALEWRRSRYGASGILEQGGA